MSGQDEAAAWVLSSHAREARLVRIEAGRLLLADAAEAAPWPGANEGLRFSSGTNRIDGIALNGVAQPIVALDARARALVRDDGMLLVNGQESGVRTGSALASLWPGALAASAAESPDEPDAVRVLQGRARRWEETLRMPMRGRVTALASRRDGDAVDLLVVLARAGGAELVRVELRQE